MERLLSSPLNMVPSLGYEKDVVLESKYPSLSGSLYPVIVKALMHKMDQTVPLTDLYRRKCQMSVYNEIENEISSGFNWKQMLCLL